MTTPSPTTLADARRLLGVLALSITGDDAEGQFAHGCHANQMAADLGPERLALAWQVIATETLTMVTQRGQTLKLAQILADRGADRPARVLVDHLIAEVTGILPLIIEEIVPGTSDSDPPRYHLAADSIPIASLDSGWLASVLPPIVEGAVRMLADEEDTRGIDPCDCCEARVECSHVEGCECSHQLVVPSDAVPVVLDDLAVQIIRRGLEGS